MNNKRLFPIHLDAIIETLCEISNDTKVNDTSHWLKNSKLMLAKLLYWSMIFYLQKKLSFSLLTFKRFLRVVATNRESLQQCGSMPLSL